MTDELEQRLRAADPVPPTVPVDSSRSPRARTLVEHLMTETPISLDSPRATRPRRWAIVAAAAAVVLAVGVAVSLSGDEDGGTSLALTAPDDGTTMGSCIQMTPEILRDAAQVAFEGTVTEIDRSSATLSVDRWFAGEEVDEVVVTGPDGAETALLGGVVLEAGGQYLISAQDGAVLSCGMSGEASDANLEGLFEAAFTG